jgi:hypothetical protein
MLLKQIKRMKKHLVMQIRHLPLSSNHSHEFEIKYYKAVKDTGQAIGNIVRLYNSQ